jgi:hypothetical protein
MASNEEWVVPATEGERRYFVVDVPGDHARDESYFDPIYEQLANGGYEALLHDLLALDIGNFHPRKMPADKNALLSQQVASLQPLDSWWVELLETGTLAGCDPRHPERAVSNKFEETITVGMHDRLVKRDGLYDQARSIEPRLRNYTSEHQLGKYLTDRGCDNTRKVLRRRGWTFPPLSACREEWEKDYPGWEWRNPNIVNWRCDDADDDDE